MTLLLGLFFLGGCLPAHNQSEDEREPHFLAGKSRVNAMDYKGAIESFQKALEVNPQSGVAHFELGWLYDQKESDPAAAIYHYERYLKFRPDPDKVEMVKTRLLACKQELARSVSLGPVMQSAQKDLQQMAEDNKKLKEQVEKLLAYSQYLEKLTNMSGAVPARGAPVAAQTLSARSSGLPSSSDSTGSPATAKSRAGSTSTVASGRMHTVKAGETLAMIGRRYGVKLDTLMAANPKLDPKRLRVGQALNIPGS